MSHRIIANKKQREGQIDKIVLGIDITTAVKIYSGSRETTVALQYRSVRRHGKCGRSFVRRQVHQIKCGLAHPLPGDVERSFAKFLLTKMRRDRAKVFISRGDKRCVFRPATRLAYDVPDCATWRRTKVRNTSGPLMEREDYRNGMADSAGLVGWLVFFFFFFLVFRLRPVEARFKN